MYTSTHLYTQVYYYILTHRPVDLRDEVKYAREGEGRDIIGQSVFKLGHILVDIVYTGQLGLQAERGEIREGGGESV